MKFNGSEYKKTPIGVLKNMYWKISKRHKTDFTIDEFIDRFINHKKFLRLHSEWRKSDCLTKLKPSLDRINPNIHYTVANTQMITWGENRHKQRMELKRDRGRHVYQSKNGVLIKTYKSQRQAVIENDEFKQQSLSHCLTGNTKTAYGFEWSYENPELLEQRG
jgi:uncharacterized protein Veg